MGSGVSAEHETCSMSSCSRVFRLSKSVTLNTLPSELMVDIKSRPPTSSEVMMNTGMMLMSSPLARSAAAIAESAGLAEGEPPEVETPSVITSMYLLRSGGVPDKASRHLRIACA